LGEKVVVVGDERFVIACTGIRQSHDEHVSRFCNGIDKF
jgi:hypothetical protein